MKNLPRVSVIGTGKCDDEVYASAKRLGGLLANKGLELVCGGLQGVMRAASEGVLERGGRTIGIMPGLDTAAANKYIEIPVATGLGHMRNFLVVLNGDVVIAVEGGYGTLCELALALKIGKTVIAMGKWASIPGVVPASGPDEACTLALQHLGNA